MEVGTTLKALRPFGKGRPDEKIELVESRVNIKKNRGGFLQAKTITILLTAVIIACSWASVSGNGLRASRSKNSVGQNGHLRAGRRCIGHPQIEKAFLIWTQPCFAYN